MKTTVTTPLIEKGTVIALNTIIPFEKVELSIALDNGCSGKGEIHRNNFRVYEKITDKDITKEVLGCNDNHAYDGYELINILQKVASYEKGIADKEIRNGEPIVIGHFAGNELTNKDSVSIGYENKLRDEFIDKVEKWWNGLSHSQKRECEYKTFARDWFEDNLLIYEDIEKMYKNENK